MTRKRIALTILALVAGVLVFFASDLAERIRLASIRQTITLTDTTRMQIHDACIYPADPNHQLLRVYVTYVGDDPNRDFEMRGEIARSPDDTAFNHIWQWQVGLSGSNTDYFWEFQDYPRNGTPIYIRIFLRPKAGGLEMVRIFQIPDRLRVTPNGEWPRSCVTKNT